MNVGLVHASCTIVDVLPSIKPGAEWTMTDSNLLWIDKKQIQPTDLEIKTAITNCNAQLTIRTQALIDVKNKSLRPQKRLDDLLIILNIN